MGITDDDVAVLRALLKRSTDEVRPGFATLGERGASRQWNVLVTATLTTLVHRLFGAERRGDEIVRWVGKVRSRPGFDPADLDPVTAEGLIRGLLGEVSSTEAIADRLEPESQIVLLFALFDDARADGPGLEELLLEAKTYGDHILAAMG